MWAPFFTSLLSVSSPSLAPVSLTMTQEECRNNTPPPSAVEIVHHSWNLFTPVEGFSKKKKSFVILWLWFMQKSKTKYRAAKTHTELEPQIRAMAHTRSRSQRNAKWQNISVFVTGHRGSESSASRVIHHPHVHTHWTEMLIFIRSCRPQDWDWIQRSNHMWHNSQVRNLKQKAQRL